MGKFFYLYLVSAIAATLLLIYELVVAYPDINHSGALFYIIAPLLLFYMANKAYHVKKDHELM